MASRKPETKKHRKVLVLKDRVRAIEKSQQGQSARSIALAMGVGKTQIQALLMNKDKIMEEWKSGGNTNAKQLAPNRRQYADVNELLFKWFTSARSRGIPVPGSLLQEKAMALAKARDNDTPFAASNGWLEAWKKRNNIKGAVLSGKAADVREEDVTSWKERLGDLCKGYDPKDIFNADETGLFFRTLPNRSLVVRKDSCKGGKQSKQRITVLLAASAMGEKLKPLVIGKSANPRCFKGVNKTALGVQYEANKKAWMVSDLFRSWLKSLDRKFAAAGRNILMFIDNCLAHPTLDLEHVELVFLPPNTTSRLQPMDAGIIQAMKLRYRRRIVQHLLARIDQETPASELAKQVNVLDAIMWLTASWSEVQPTTIQKCFSHCGFAVEAPSSELDEPEFDELPAAESVLGDQTLPDYAAIDNELGTNETLSDDWENRIFQEARGEPDDHDDAVDASGDECDAEECTESTEVGEVSGKEALSCISTLQQFTLQRGLSPMAMDVEKLGAFVNKLEAQRKEKLQQGTLDSWLQK